MNMFKLILLLNIQNFRSFRFCPFCLKRNACVIGDEFHLFLVCPVFTEFRLNMYLKPEWLRAIATIPIFYSIMSSSDTTSILSTTRYLISAFNYRNEALFSLSRFSSPVHPGLTNRGKPVNRDEPWRTGVEP